MMKVIFNSIVLLLIVGGLCLWTIYDNRYAYISSLGEKTQENLVSDFSYISLLGPQKKQSLYDNKGRVILLHFWATWCPPCLVEFPDLVKLAAAMPEKFMVLAIAKQDSRKEIDKFLTKLDLSLPDNFTITIDSHNHISEDLYGVYKLPETFLISSDFKILQKVTGPQDNWSSPRWVRKIQDYISEIKSQ